MAAQRSETRPFYRNIYLFVRLSVCHTRESCLNGSKYQNALYTLLVKYRSIKLFLKKRGKVLHWWYIFVRPFDGTF